MSVVTSPKKPIDLKIIEELKKKRSLQKERLTGY